MDIGERIEEFRLKNKHRFKTKKKFAEALSMPPEQLYLYIKNKIKPGSNILDRLANLGCDINWLLTGKTHAELLEIIKLGEDSLAAVKDIQQGLIEHTPEQKELISTLESQMHQFQITLDEIKNKSHK